MGIKAETKNATFLRLIKLLKIKDKNDKSESKIKNATIMRLFKIWNRM